MTLRSETSDVALDHLVVRDEGGRHVEICISKPTRSPDPEEVSIWVTDPADPNGADLYRRVPFASLCIALASLVRRHDARAHDGTHT